jgi:hypothetical protein
LLFLSLLAENEDLPFRETGTEQGILLSLMGLGNYAWGFNYGNPYPQGSYDLPPKLLSLFT